MIRYTTTILKFGEQGEKTGWTYIVVPPEIAAHLLPGNKKSFRVKGKLDAHHIAGIALLPMGEGSFIMPLKTELRKSIGKSKGDTLEVQLSVDTIPYRVNAAFVECMEDDPAALHFFRSLPRGHQHYFSKWIESAQTDATRVKRIAQAVSALSRKMGFSEMVRAGKADRDKLSGH